MEEPKQNRRVHKYDPEFRIKVVKRSLENNLNAEEVDLIFGVKETTWEKWKNFYLSGGEKALIRPYHKAKKVAKGNAWEKFRSLILEVKRKFPFFGVGRIFHWIRRTVALPLSRRQIHKTLKEEGLLEKPQSKREYKHKVKHFERSLPNQLWQSDITIFTIARGLRVYLIGFMDDHSRYITGWGLYAGQSGGLVLEVLRNAIATYGHPQEILTDNGRQYKSWQGETDFQRELRTMGIKHITSRPHHPQTLGKIESFWGHLKREFLKHVVMGGL